MWAGIFDRFSGSSNDGKVRIFWTAENAIPNFSRCNYALSFDYSDDPRSLRWPLYASNLADLDREYPGRCLIRDENENLQGLMAGKRRFCDFIYSNQRAASERIDFFKLLSRYDSVTSGGSTANNLGFVVGDKWEFQKASRFSIAFENASTPGYTTEKIVDAFRARSVPIYWGNSRITEDFNPQSFINCHEHTDSQGNVDWDQVLERVIQVDQDDFLYERMLRSPVFHDNVPNKYCKADYLVSFFEKVFST
jgi:hypothetical protein